MVESLPGGGPPLRRGAERSESEPSRDKLLELCNGARENLGVILPILEHALREGTGKDDPSGSSTR
jgi:hypothetical protein